MTPLLLILLAFGCLSPAVQGRRPTVTALEGTWREPLLPGEEVGDKLVVTIKGEQVFVIWYEGTFQGALRADSVKERVVIFGDIALLDDKREHPRRSHNCRWFLNDDQLFLEVSPIRALDPGNRRLDRAPVTFLLEKVKK